MRCCLNENIGTLYFRSIKNLPQYQLLNNYDCITTLVHNTTDITSLPNNSNTRFESIDEIDIRNSFKKMQKECMNTHTPILNALLSETPFDAGYRSQAEEYFDKLSKNYGMIADTILQNIYLNSMYENPYITKHILFIIMNLPPERRNIVQIIPLSGLSNPDIEIQDLSVECFETWGDKTHLPALKKLFDETRTKWFKQYIGEVIEELEDK